MRRIARRASAEASRQANFGSGEAASAGLFLATVSGDGLAAERACQDIAASHRADRRIRAALGAFPPMSLAGRLARDFGMPLSRGMASWLASSDALQRWQPEHIPDAFAALIRSPATPQSSFDLCWRLFVLDKWVARHLAVAPSLLNSVKQEG